MPRIAGERRGVKVNEVLGATLTKVRAEVSERLGREVEQALEAEINQMLSVVSAPTPGLPSPILRCSSAIQSGTVASCAPRVGSNASTAICGAGYALRRPIMPTRAFAP